MWTLKFGSFGLLGAIVWIALGQVKAEDLSQERCPSNLGSGKWSW